MEFRPEGRPEKIRCLDCNVEVVVQRFGPVPRRCGACRRLDLNRSERYRKENQKRSTRRALFRTEDGRERFDLLTRLAAALRSEVDRRGDELEAVVTAGRAPWCSIFRWSRSPFWYARLCANGVVKQVSTRETERADADRVARSLLLRHARGEHVATGRRANGEGVKDDPRSVLRVHVGPELMADLRATLPHLSAGQALRRLAIEALAFRDVYGVPLAESVSFGEVADAEAERV